MAKVISTNWLIYVYASDTMKGTLAENKAAEIPLSAFTGIVSGVPTEPEWTALEIYGMYPSDVGERETRVSAGGYESVLGAGRWGGNMQLLEYDFNSTLAQYLQLLQKLRKPYTYIWFNDYPLKDYVLSSAADHAMRIVFGDVPIPEREDAYIDMSIKWSRYCQGL